MIRLGGTVENILARLGEKTLEFAEHIPIQWMNGTTIEEKIEGFESAGEAILELIANYSSAQAEGTVELIAQNGKAVLAALLVYAGEGSQRVYVEVSGKSRIIFDGLTENSNFLQRFSGGIGSFASNRVNWASVPTGLTQTSGSHFLNGVTVTHGLGTTPVAVFAMSNNQAVLLAVNTITSTTFKVVGYNAFGTEALNPIPFYWVAFV